MQVRLVDSNVLIVASAVDEGSPFRPDATPVEEAALRQQVFDWLEAFEADPTRHAVLDVDWHVCATCRYKLTDQDYGWLAMMHKMDRGEVVWVDVLLDKNGNAVLPPELAEAVTDLADRKMVAAAWRRWTRATPARSPTPPTPTGSTAARPCTPSVWRWKTCCLTGCRRAGMSNTRASGAQNRHLCPTISSAFPTPPTLPGWPPVRPATTKCSPPAEA